MTCDEWTGYDVCGREAVWRVICHAGGIEVLACAAHAAYVVKCHATCSVELVPCG